jgi:high-affinity iron transporter
LEFRKRPAMFQALLICFREGLEAFLVISVASLYLRRTQQVALLTALRLGLILSVAGSAVLGVVLARMGAMSTLWAGFMALVAAATVTWCIVHMRKAGKTIGHDIQARLGEVTLATGAKAWWSVLLFTAFMVSREGIEAATMIASLAANTDARPMAIGGALGLALAATISLLWARYGRKVNLGRFFRVTSWFMAVFAVQLLIYALHEFTESGSVPGIDNAWWHHATEDLAEGWIAQLISMALVVLPTAWLIAAHLADRRSAVAQATSSA